jgi:hypothetical protein
MRTAETNSRLAILTFIVVVAVFSSLTLWLLGSWMKYVFFALELFLIIVVYLIVSSFDFRLSINHIKIKNVRIDWVIDVFFIVSATSLLFLRILGVEGGYVQLILSLLVTSILPGYALLTIFGLNRRFSNLERFVLSFVFSLVFTGFLTLSLLFVNENARLYFILSAYVLLGTVSFLKRKRDGSFQTQSSFAKNIDFLGIIVAIAPMVISFCFLYPGFATLPGTDISRHYSSSVLLWRTPELYNSFSYFLANLHESTFIAVSNASVISIQTSLATLNLILPLAFYVMAKSYLESVDRRLPILSTVIYSIFNGFAWISLIRLKLNGTAQSEFSLLSLVNDGAFNGAMYSQQLWYYAPLSLSLTILFVQFMLIRKTDFGKKTFVVLFSLLTVASYMTHVTEAVIFSLFIAFYAFFSRSKTVRFNDVLLSSTIGFAFVGAYSAVIQYLLGKTLALSLAFTFIIIVVLASVYIYRTLNVQERLIAILPKINGELIARSLVYTTTFVYFLGLATWVGGIPSFHTNLVEYTGMIPWFVYPVFLGVGGVLMMMSLYYLLEDHKTTQLLMPFLLLVIFSLLFGRALTFININLFNAGYLERRFSSFFFLASAVIAPIAIIKVVDNIRHNQVKIRRALLLATTVSIVIVYGVQSFFLVTEYWAFATAPSNLISEPEFQAINYLSNVLKQDEYAYTITLTPQSKDL